MAELKGKSESDAKRVAILDFGSQYTQLIARKVRELGIYSEIFPYWVTEGELAPLSTIGGIILSGGPRSVTDEDAPLPGDFILRMGIPLLGICYGLQYISNKLGGKVAGTGRREYGFADLNVDTAHPLFSGLDEVERVWMSHGDALETIPPDFHAIAHTENAPYAAVANADDTILGVQFHPEVHHTEKGKQMLANFLFKICNLSPDWTVKSFVEMAILKIKEQVGAEKVLCALSGGVDSTVMATLIRRAIGQQLLCVLVDNGLMRQGEVEQVQGYLSAILPLEVVDAGELFINNLRGVEDPEEKRRIIGHTFIEVFEERARKEQGLRFLAQGTLYPDFIESVSVKGPSAIIKSHHNVGGLPEGMELELVEPLKYLFKDEVREVGRELDLPEEIVGRHPFPGPGLAVRILGEVTPQRLELVRRADAIAIEELKKADYYDKVWQALVVLLPVRTVGVMGDARTYENVVALRCVTSTDGMTADWTHLPESLLSSISTRITNEVRGINRVVYDISSKPPATIEWE